MKERGPRLEGDGCDYDRHGDHDVHAHEALLWSEFGHEQSGRNRERAQYEERDQSEVPRGLPSLLFGLTFARWEKAMHVKLPL
jgi:hypothetical protein